MSTKIFAYGALSEGMIQFHKIQNLVAPLDKAWTRGAVYRLKVGFPVVLKQGQQIVIGQLLEVKDSEFVWALMDELIGCNPLDLENSLYHRKLAEVHTKDNQSLSAWVYFLNPLKLPPNAQLIGDGDWQRSLRENPPLLDQLTERHRVYIQKLGAASGREVVPIHDLKIYRELMGLELIVDKGRRLALTKLGQEVCRYLG